MLPYTTDQLEDLMATELDEAIVKTVVGNRTSPRTKPIPFSSSWEAFGLLVGNMRRHGFKPDVTNRAGELVDFGWTRIGVPLQGRNRWSYTGVFEPRTAAIAAVLTCQANPQFARTMDKATS
jgi:hypothetical protein